MSQGTVIFFNNQTGFGIIAEDKGFKVFVHRSALQTEGFTTLQEGQRVWFDIQETPKEPLAINVKSI
jgi:CspA family cold shock protein